MRGRGVGEQPIARSALILFATVLLLPASGGPGVTAAGPAPGRPEVQAGADTILWIAGRPAPAEAAPRLVDGYLFVAARPAFSTLGVTVEPLPASSRGEAPRCRLAREDRELILTAGSTSARLNGQEFDLRVAPWVEREEWLVPLSRVAIALRLSLTWDKELGRLVLTGGAGEPGEKAGKSSGSEAGSTAGALPSSLPARLWVSLQQDGDRVGLRLEAGVPFRVQVRDAVGEKQAEIDVDGLPAGVKVALPAILRGSWPSPLMEVALIPAAVPAPGASDRATGTVRLQVRFTTAARLEPVRSEAKPVTDATPAPAGKAATTAGPRYRADLWVAPASLAVPVASPVSSALSAPSVLPPSGLPPSLSLLAAGGQSSPRTLTRVEWQREAGSSGRLILRSTAAVPASLVPSSAAGGTGAEEPASFRSAVWQDPLRLVIDLPGVTWEGEKRTITLNDPDFARLTVERTPSGEARLVLEAAHPGLPLVRRDGKTGELLADVLRVVPAVEVDGPTGTVTIRSSGPVEARVFVLPDPERLVVDLLGAAIVGSGPRINHDPGAAGNPVSRVRVAQFDPRTVRVVLELVKPFEVKVSQSEDGSRLDLAFRDGPDVWAAFPGGRASREAGEARDTPPAQGSGASRTGTTVSWVQRWQPPSGPAGVKPGEAVIEAPPRPEGTKMFAPAMPVMPVMPAVPVIAGGGAAVEETLTHLAGRFIVLDPGHGGSDPGAIGVNGAREKDLTLAIALDLAARLRAAGARVELTRESDTLPAWPQRVAPANLGSADALLSIHLNSFPGPEARGIEVYYAASRPGAEELARTLLRSLAQRLGTPGRWARARDDLYVLRESLVPAVLLELGYLSHPEEAAKLVERQYQEEIARAIAVGLDQYFAGR